MNVQISDTYELVLFNDKGGVSLPRPRSLPYRIHNAVFTENFIIIS